MLLIAGLIGFTSSYASHFSGGELRYEFNGTNYDVYLSVYKICEGGAPLPNSATVQYSSVSQSSSGNISMTFMGFDTTNINCAPAVSRCVNPQALIPGYITAHFKGTITFPAQANDWVLSYTNAARIASIANLTNTSSQMYLYTNIDNSAAINSNPLLASSPSYYMLSGASSVIPLQAIDPEGDNVVYDLVAPMTATGTSAVYNAGFSATAPFGTGGTAAINNTTKTLTLNSPSTGSYAVALRMREYRNTVLVGEHFREFTVLVLPGTGSAPTIPAPTSTTNFTYLTCPGQNNSITLNFTDPTSTDSVYLTVMPPTMAGWTFSSTVTPGIPTASTTITWTTPSGMNPATLPHFYIKVRARDNGCPRAVADYAVVVRTRQCNVDSVWPGDANGDFTVNIYDPLHIAIASGQTGPTRPGATTTWSAQACSNWTGVFTTNNVNMKHADCNGDGTVNNTDLGAVTANYNLSHPKGGRNKGTGSNDLYFDMTNVTLAPGKTVSIPVKFGSATQTISDVYGLGVRVLINGITPAAAPTLNNATSWIAATNAVNFTHPINTTAVDWVLARTDQQNTSGQGTIATLNFIVPNNAMVGTDVTFSFDDAVVVDNRGIENYDVNPIDATATIQFPESVEGIAGNLESVAIVPNPSGDVANMHIVLAKRDVLTISVTDITGRVVWTANSQYEAGTQRIELPASMMSSGVYTIRIAGEDNSYTSVLKWVKQ